MKCFQPQSLASNTRTKNAESKAKGMVPPLFPPGAEIVAFEESNHDAQKCILKAKKEGHCLALKNFHEPTQMCPPLFLKI